MLMWRIAICFLPVIRTLGFAIVCRWINSNWYLGNFTLLYKGI